MSLLGALARGVGALGIVFLWAVVWGVPSITSYRAGQYGEAALAAAVLLLPFLVIAWVRFDVGLPVSRERSRAGE